MLRRQLRKQISSIFQIILKFIFLPFTYLNYTLKQIYNLTIRYLSAFTILWLNVAKIRETNTQKKRFKYRVLNSKNDNFRISLYDLDPEYEAIPLEHKGYTEYFLCNSHKYGVAVEISGQTYSFNRLIPQHGFRINRTLLVFVLLLMAVLFTLPIYFFVNFINSIFNYSFVKLKLFDRFLK